MMQYVLVGPFRAHLVEGANYIFFHKYFCIRRLILGGIFFISQIKLSLIVNWLSVFLFEQ